MKVGILTFHRGINHGAFYQALATQTYLRSLGVDAIILNYQSKKHLILELSGLLFRGGLRQKLQMAKKVRAFRVQQRRQNVIPTKPTSNQSKISKLSIGFDFIVVGSDIIWSHETRSLGSLAVYFGKALFPRVGIVSFAASMGPSTRPFPSNLASELGRFNGFSVRDENTRRNLGRLGFKSELVPDPTLLLDPRSMEDVNPSFSVPKVAYVLVYCSPLSRDVKIALTNFANTREMNLVVTGYHQGNLGADYTHAGPGEWLELFKNAALVVTNTFHGTVFSTLCQTNFVTLHREAIENKALDYLSRIGLSARYSYEGFDPKIASIDVEWREVGVRMNKERTKSYEFLDRALMDKRSFADD